MVSLSSVTSTSRLSASPTLSVTMLNTPNVRSMSGNRNHNICVIIKFWWNAIDVTHMSWMKFMHNHNVGPSDSLVRCLKPVNIVNADNAAMIRGHKSNGSFGVHRVSYG